MSSANFTQYYSSLDDAGPLGRESRTTACLTQPPDFYGGNINQWPDYLYVSRQHAVARAGFDAEDRLLLSGLADRPMRERDRRSQRVPDRTLTAIRSPRSSRPTFATGAGTPPASCKLQYQKNLGSTAYVRLFGYTFYSNTNRASPNGWGNNVTLGRYELPVRGRLAYRRARDAVRRSVLRPASARRHGLLPHVEHAALLQSELLQPARPAGKQLHQRQECYATYTSARYHVGDLAPCNKLVTQGDFRRSVWRLQRAEPVRGRRTSGDRAGLRGRRVDAADILRQQCRHQRGRSEDHERFAERPVAAERSLVHQPGGSLRKRHVRISPTRTIPRRTSGSRRRSASSA